jgi:hypothetical protein
MATLNDWSTTAASNASVGAINFAEGQLPSTVNNSNREVLKQIADVRDAAVTLTGWYVSGHVIQTVYAEYTSYSTIGTIIPADDSIPQSTEGVEVVTAAITPKKASSKIRVRFTGMGTTNTAVGALTVALFKDSDTDALAASLATSVVIGSVTPLDVSFEHTAPGVSLTTYKIRVGPSAGNAWLNGNQVNRFFGGASRAVLTIEEIGA